MSEYFDIRYCKIYFKLQFPEAASLPRDKVSMIRGGVGEMLLRQHCLSDRKCSECNFREDCAVPRIYYHPLKIKPKFVTTGESLGYVWECSDKRSFIKAGGNLCVQLILFGNTIIYFQDILQALYSLGVDGMGQENAKFQIVEVRNEQNKSILKYGNIYNKNIMISKLKDYIKRNGLLQKENILIRFVSPLSLKYRGEFLREYHGRAMMESVLRRIYLLNCMEGNIVEMPELLPEPVIINQKVKNVQVLRYSNTHKSHITLHGISGECVLADLPE